MNFCIIIFFLSWHYSGSVYQTSKKRIFKKVVDTYCYCHLCLYVVVFYCWLYCCSADVRSMRSTLCVSSDTCRSCPTSCLLCHQIPADITCVKYLPVITVHSTTSGELLFFIHSSGTNMRPVWLTAQTSTALTPSCPVTPTTVHRQLRIYCPKQVKLSKYTNKYYLKKHFQI